MVTRKMKAFIAQSKLISSFMSEYLFKLILVNCIINYEEESNLRHIDGETGKTVLEQ